MWLFTTIGFFSVTASDDPKLLQVRARVRGDLDNLRTKYLPALTATIQLKNRDYPYRGYVDHASFGGAMVQIVDDLTYSNFKNEVAKVQGWPRERLYAKVWSVMNNAETKLADDERVHSEPSPYSNPYSRGGRSSWDDWRSSTDDSGPVAVVAPPVLETVTKKPKKATTSALTKRKR